MDKPIRVLIVEDSEDDALLVVRELKRGGYDTTFERVDTAETMSAVLTKQTWDVIICDHRMPYFSATEALPLLLQSGLDLPFIIVSGTIGDGTAVAAMKAGAHDYIMKDNLKRLVPAIERELREVEVRRQRRQAEEALRESEEKLRLMFESVTDGITVTDLNGVITEVNERVLAMHGFNSRDAILGKSAFELIAHPDHKKAQINLRKTLEQGVAENIEYTLLKADGSEFAGELSAAVMRDGFSNPAGFIAITRDITERKLFEEERKHGIEKQLNATRATVSAVAMTTEIRDPYTAGHQRRVADLACAIAKEMGISDDQIEGLGIAGVVHDIGKMYIPAEILSKPGKLSEIEFSMIKMHPQAGYDILKTIESPWPIAQAVLQHHERLDGSGYPSGLLGEDIILEARILGVSDVVEAINSHRPYRPALGIDKALEEISQKKGVLYNPDVVDVCLRLFTEKGFKFGQAEGSKFT
ncbi:HD domain-containing phosphohydrolase [Chloroflexota bacterium]